MSRNKRIRRTLGDVLAIPLGNGMYSYGRVLREPLVAFYNLRCNEILPVENVLAAPVAFTLLVMNYPITQGVWPVVGNVALSAELIEEPLFFKKDAITGAFSIYQDSTGSETPATCEQCNSLECAAVWEPHQVVDRLNDFFSGRQNKWVDSLRP